MGKRGRKPNLEHQRQAAKLRSEGLTLQEIGNRMGVSRQRVDQLLARSDPHEKLVAIKCRECGAVIGRVRQLGQGDTEDHRERRPLPFIEFEALVQTTRKGRTRRRLAGPDRALLYRVTSFVGFRAQQMASLKPESFRLDGEAPTVTVEAAYSKHRREDVQPIRQDLAELLKDWMTGKPAGERLWPGTWWKHVAKMVRADLEVARAEWIKEAGEDQDERTRREQSSYLAFRDDASRVFDFHALRGQYVSNLEAAGVTPKMLQTLARHSRIETTLKHYARVQLADTRAALDKLPPLSGTGQESAAPTLQATGTDAAP